MRIYKILKWHEWIDLLLLITLCVFAFIVKEYVIGIILITLTVLGTVGSVRSNIKNK